MNRGAVYGHKSCRGVEIFIFNLTKLAAVNRVCNVGAKACNVEEIRTASHFFVGCEADLDLTVLYLGMGEQVLCKCHNLSNTRLVIGTEKSASIGIYQLSAEVTGTWQVTW